MVASSPLQPQAPPRAPGPQPPGPQASSPPQPSGHSLDKSSIVLWRSGAEVALSDLDTACYAVMRGVKFVRGRQVAPTDYEIVLYDADHAMEAIVAEFTNSLCAKFADTVRRVKKALLRPPRSTRGYRW